MFGGSNQSWSVWYFPLRRHDFCCNLTQPHIHLHEYHYDFQPHDSTRLSGSLQSAQTGYRYERRPSASPSWWISSHPSLHSLVLLFLTVFFPFFSPLFPSRFRQPKMKWHHVKGKLKTYPQGPAGEPGTSGRRRIPTTGKINQNQWRSECFLTVLGDTGNMASAT